MAAAGRIVQLSVSAGGVPKQAIAQARATRLGLEGDQQRDLQHHGGPDRALCLFPLEAIRALSVEGHTIVPGALGENITTEGLDWSLVVPGAHLLLGERVLAQVTRYTTPCHNIAPVFVGRDFSRVSQKRNPGWSRVYARVLAEGGLRAGDAVRLLSELEAAEVGAAGGP
jgi:MOSC domain-containing protein YiiM